MSTCRSSPTPGTASCCSTPSTPPGRSSSCSRRSKRCAASRRRRWCASPATTPIRSASRLTPGHKASLCRWSNTPAEAEAAVRACRYHPLGNRSNAGVRGEWGEFKNYRDYLDAVNNGLLIVPMIETNQSLENLDAIASVPGVDVLLIGPSDLSIELGVPLDYSCDTYQRALDKIAAAAAKRGIAAGMYFIPPEMDPNFFVQKGFKFFTMPWGPWAKAGIQNGLSGIKR